MEAQRDYSLAQGHQCGCGSIGYKPGLQGHSPGLCAAPALSTPPRLAHVGWEGAALLPGWMRAFLPALQKVDGDTVTQCCFVEGTQGAMPPIASCFLSFVKSFN